MNCKDDKKNCSCGCHKEITENPLRDVGAPYGYCPTCGDKGMIRERRPDGDDICVNKHRYPSGNAVGKNGRPIRMKTIHSHPKPCPSGECFKLERT